MRVRTFAPHVLLKRHKPQLADIIKRDASAQAVALFQFQFPLNVSPCVQAQSKVAYTRVNTRTYRTYLPLARVCHSQWQNRRLLAQST